MTFIWNRGRVDYGNSLSYIMVRCIIDFSPAVCCFDIWLSNKIRQLTRITSIAEKAIHSNILFLRFLIMNKLNRFRLLYGHFQKYFGFRHYDQYCSVSFCIALKALQNGAKIRAALTIVAAQKYFE